MSLLVWWWHRPFAILPAFLSLWTLCCPFRRWYWQWLLLSSFLFPLYGLIGCLCCLESLLGIYMLGLLLVLPRLVSGSFSFLFPPFITLHFAAPNCMWYLLATRLVTSSISCSFSRSWWIRHTSSIHRSESRVMFACVTHPRFLCLSSLAISSISVAHSITDSTPPCLILSLICIFLVSPCLVCILAVRLELRFLIILKFFPFTPFWCRT